MPAQTQIQRAAKLFQAKFGRPARLAALAPGRVNLIGEHTDYNAGFVLPMAVELQTVVMADRTEAERAHVISTSQVEPVEFDLQSSIQPGPAGWGRYVRGVVAGTIERGLNPGGFEAVVDSTVPAGAGLASSAALEVAVATLVEELAGGRLDLLDKALLCQRAEHEFAGVPCGIMDQFASVFGLGDHALLIDCRARTHRLVPLDGAAVRVVIIDSGVRRNLSDGRYAQRRLQCEQAAAALGVAELRQVSIEQLRAAAGHLDGESYRRARHVLSENERTLRAAEALEMGDYRKFGELMYASHASLRDDFEVSCPQLDLLVELAAAIGADGGVFGSRMSGAGFGGCTVSLVQADSAENVCATIGSQYAQRTGKTPTSIITRPADGARTVRI